MDLASDREPGLVHAGREFGRRRLGKLPWGRNLSWSSLKYTTPVGTRTIRFRYDAQGRLLRLTGPAGLSDTTHLTYNDESLLTQIGLPTGQSQSFTYTPTHQPLTQMWGSFDVNAAFGRVWDSRPTKLVCGTPGRWPYLLDDSLSVL